jgi:hypothetical protein
MGLKESQRTSTSLQDDTMMCPSGQKAATHLHSEQQFELANNNHQCPRDTRVECQPLRCSNL